MFRFHTTYVNIVKDQWSWKTSHLEPNAFQWTKQVFRSNSTSFGPPKTTTTPSVFSSLSSAIQSNKLSLKQIGTQNLTRFPQIHWFHQISTISRFTSTFTLQTTEDRNKIKSMFVSIRHPTPETRWMGSTGGRTFFYIFSQKNLKSWPKPVQKRGPRTSIS